MQEVHRRCDVEVSAPTWGLRRPWSGTESNLFREYIDRVVADNIVATADGSRRGPDRRAAVAERRAQIAEESARAAVRTCRELIQVVAQLVAKQGTEIQRPGGSVGVAASHLEMVLGPEPEEDDSPGFEFTEELFLAYASSD